MLRAGDEFLHTQRGNNNPYNQDNETTWLDWSRRERHGEMHRFVREMIRLRKRHPSLCRSHFWREDVAWFGANGAVDLSPDAHAFAYRLRGGSENDADLYVMLNMGPADLLMTEELDQASQWRRVVDTSLPAPQDIVAEASAPHLHSSTYTVRSRSVVVLARERDID